MCVIVYMEHFEILQALLRNSTVMIVLIKFETSQ